MLTECPSCLTVFRVTGAILKMGHGQVRCGKCRKQFDAIECMIEDEAQESASPSPTQTQSSESDADQPFQSASSEEAPLDTDASQEMEFDAAQYAEEVTMEGSRIEISGTYRMPSDDPTSEEKIVREHVVIDRATYGRRVREHAKRRRNKTKSSAKLSPTNRARLNSIRTATTANPCPKRRITCWMKSPEHATSSRPTGLKRRPCRNVGDDLSTSADTSTRRERSTQNFMRSLRTIGRACSGPVSGQRSAASSCSLSSSK